MLSNFTAFIEIINASPAVLCVLTVFLGLMVGSFLNVVIYRLPKMIERDMAEQCASLSGDTPPAQNQDRFNLFFPRSRCPGCGHAISALENIPVFSFLALRGRCRACAQPIKLRYPIIEALTGLISGYVAYRYGPSWQTVGALIFIWSLIALTFIDFDTQWLPDDITLPLVWCGLLFNLQGVFTTIHSAIIGAVAGYLLLWTIYWSFKLLTHKEGMGYGDFKLLAAIGAWLGWQMLPLTILLSSVVGAVVGISLMLFAKHGRDVPIPFGPYLAGGGVIAMFWGQELTQLYLGMFLN